MNLKNCLIPAPKRLFEIQNTFQYVQGVPNWYKGGTKSNVTPLQKHTKTILKIFEKLQRTLENRRNPKDAFTLANKTLTNKRNE